MACKRIGALLMLTVMLCGGAGCTPLHFFSFIAHPIPVPPWTADRIEEKFSNRLKHRTPILPPLVPDAPPPTCEDPPSDEEIIRALPKVARGIPYVYEEFRDDFNIVTEKLVDQIDPCTMYPLVGAAQLHHCHFKCTVYYRERIQSSYPFPFQLVEDRVEVLYIDKDHLHRCVGPDEGFRREHSRDLQGP
jgi:hypothetical protein